MIIGSQPRIFELDALLRSLAAARATVARFENHRRTRSTGFFVLPDLLVAPAFAFEAPVATEQVSLQCDEWTAKVPEEVELVDTIALLRVPGRTGPVVQFNFSDPRPGQAVAIVQRAPFKPDEANVSFGTLRSADASFLSYDADTDVGSAGAPVFDETWQVIGMHTSSRAHEKLNEGLAVAALIVAFRKSSAWDAIREAHQLADVAAAQSAEAAAPDTEVDRVLVRAALTVSIDPQSLSAEDAARIEPHVIDSAASRWTMRANARNRVLRTVRSLRTMKLYSPLRPPRDPLQRIVVRVLEGPPYDLETVDEEALPLWIQVCRWFDGTAAPVPTSAEVMRVLERRRVRSRLDVVAGDFRGRADELLQLQEWWKSSAPLALTGIGGIGKSALIARFASTLPKETLLLWLDFDRADLAPDDAASVLSQIVQQAKVQLEAFEAPEIDAKEWEKTAKRVGTALKKALPRGAAALLVLDSFEAAQYALRYQDLWPVLEAIAGKVPRLRLAVTGRATVPELRLRGKAGKSVHLEGLTRADAAAWLQEHRVDDPAVLEQVLDLAQGVPLILLLAVRLLEAGGSVADLPEKLPPEILTGFLYGRILNRVQNAALKPVAMAALVLRRLTAEMVEPVLRGLVELPEGETAAWFPELTREMALVASADVLRLRQDVRGPALQLLERDNPELVRAINERAAAWYAAQNTDDAEVAAELVYYRLRMGDLQGAEVAWRDGVGRFLGDVDEDLAQHPRQWLQVRLGTFGIDPYVQDAVEAYLAEQIREARRRGHREKIESMLRRYPARLSSGALAFEAAYELWGAGKAIDAAAFLDHAEPVAGIAARNRQLLRAMLFAQAGDAAAADKLLGTLEETEAWSDRAPAGLYTTAVRAARIHLFVDLDAELGAAKEGVVSGISPNDVVLPLLRARSRAGAVMHESVIAVRSLDIDHPKAIAAFVDEGRRSGEFASLARRRWRLATTGSFLADAYRVATEDALPLAAAIAGTVILFGNVITHGTDSAHLSGPLGPISEAVVRGPATRGKNRIAKTRWPRIERLFDEGAGIPPPPVYFDSAPTGEAAVVVDLNVRWLTTDARVLALHLLTPNPLEQLLHEIAGFSSEAL